MGHFLGGWGAEGLAQNAQGWHNASKIRIIEKLHSGIPWRVVLTEQ